MKKGKLKIQALIDHGILYEINQKVLHPLGLSMSICRPEEPQEDAGTFQVLIAQDLIFAFRGDYEEKQKAFDRFLENRKAILTAELESQGIQALPRDGAAVCREACSRPDPLTQVMQWAFNVTASSFERTVYPDLGSSSYALSKFKLMQENFGMWWLELDQFRKKQVLAAATEQG